MDHEELTNIVIGCAFKVYNVLGFGFLESVYEKCMMIELKNSGVEAEAQKEILVDYEGHIVGEFKADILVKNEIIVELKSLRYLLKTHEVQLVNYLTATKKDVGLIINFGEKTVQVRRKVRDLNYYSKKSCKFRKSCLEEIL